MNKRKVDDPSNAEPSLLQLPWTDFPSVTNQFKSPNDQADDSLLLLQLPTDIPVSSFLEAASNHTDTTESVRIAIRDQESEPDTPNHPCCLIIPTLGRTLALSRVETSNSYILVPTQTTGNKEQLSHVTMNARLLRERDTFVIEAADITNYLSSTVMGRFQLKQYLKSSFTFPITKIGCTASQLTLQFPCTQNEIMQALSHVRAFTFPSSVGEPNTFGWVREEEFYWSVQAILFTLNELDTPDYATQGILLTTFVPQAANQLQTLLVHTVLTESETQALVHHVLHFYFCQQHLESADSMILDVTKVATLLAKLLFLERGKWEKQDFIDKWHSRMPGVGPMYQPNVDALKGLCIEQMVQDEVYLRHFPQDSLPLDPQIRFQKLFQLVPMWKWQDIEPYICPLIDGLREYHPGESQPTGIDPMNPVVSSLWMKYANVTKDDQGHLWYVAK